MIHRQDTTEKKAAMVTAQMMAAAARTAPKAKGADNLEIIIVEGPEKDKLAEEMRKIAKENKAAFFERDAGNVDQAHVVFLAGTRIQTVGVAVCGYCGFKDCAENQQNNGICTFNSGDLGLAVGSAAAVAADHHCDNRVMFTAGKAAMLLEYFKTDVKIAYAIPLSVSGKSPFFDRK
ncbi:MAG: ferredoxin [Tindallia sp. MSAO_Bac2]|nr:MAG: ferredoxin [Tindallia sp. MSAO_Bac2]